MKSSFKQGLAAVLTAAIIAAAAVVHPLGFFPRQTGQIYLYGEYHGVEVCLEKEFELWSSCYHGSGMRHLFIEEPYYVAEYLNMWMQTGNEEILDVTWQHWSGYDAYNQSFMDFYRRIREECPETVFHGTDIGFAYQSVGARFVEYLEHTGQTDTEQYRLARENIEQGRYYYEHDRDDVYRENMMAENFVREMEGLNGADVMGIYGSAHNVIDETDYLTGTVPCMTSQLHERYGDKLHPVQLADLIEPIREETITIGDREYTAQYYGKDYFPVSEEVKYWELWRLKGVFDEFRYNPLTFGSHIYDTYFINVEKGDILVESFTYADGHVERFYFRADDFKGRFGICAQGFQVE